MLGGNNLNRPFNRSFFKTFNRSTTRRHLESVTYVLELLIVGLIIGGLAVGIFNFFKYLPAMLNSTGGQSYEIFESFLSFALLLVVGIELILMIVYHSTEAIVELVLFVVARKMLIYSHTTLDLALGSIAIAIIFATIKYLVRDPSDDHITKTYQQHNEEIRQRLEK